MAAIWNPSFVPLVLAIAFFLGLVWHQNILKINLEDKFQRCAAAALKIKKEPVKEEKELPVISALQSKINNIFHNIEKHIPTVRLTSFNRSTSARNSKAFISNPRAQYCIGEDLVVQLDMYDYINKRKTYGGDFIRSRLFSQELGASVSGKVEDLNNGSYFVHFPLYWEGNVQVSSMLFHPSEGISALWRSRHSSLGVLGFQGKFENFTQNAVTECHFKLNTTKEVCEYLDPDDEEAFYCIKPSDLPCDSLTDMKAVNLFSSYLTKEEAKLFQRSNIAVEIPKNFKVINVENCKKYNDTAKPKCETGMTSPFPSGYFYKNIWNPVYCNMTLYTTKEHFIKCLQRKKLFLIGDSTLRQFIMHFTEGVKILDYFGNHEKGWSSWPRTRLALSMEKDIFVLYKRHGFPLECSAFYYFKEDMYTSRQIDLQGGGKDTIIVITMGQHFRQFPLQLYIRRALNIRRAIERLFLRSPDTKVIIKTENTREMTAPVERIGDFHGYTQYLVLREVFQGINVGFVDAWDMSVSSATANVHPPGYTLQGIMSLTFTFACY
ncbi:NXPE family member 2-like [Pelobates fuscus]|uniref:NXPE family member 2-like n=1 Tax=Pelobates fuscus TaxID=191477 RepID=UPI002FE453E6